MENRGGQNIVVVDEVHTAYFWGIHIDGSERTSPKVAFRETFGKLGQFIGNFKVLNYQESR